MSARRTAPQKPDTGSVELVDSRYAKTAKELLAFAKQIRDMGAPTELQLPRIVVIGNQSAGKSSLVEAISGISVPRDAGTCTRCPMECRMSRSDEPWSCQISLRWEFGEDGNPFLEPEEELFGEPVTNRTQVEGMLRRAQSAILNPNIDAEFYLNAEVGAVHGGKNELLFSRNVVCVDIQGPDLVDLSFVDLPGIVQNADSNIVKLVEDLVTSYIEQRSLILVTLPMSDDIENQKAARLAMEADPAGTRTIGVLTKPDTLPTGSTKARDLWADVLEGRRHVLTHGYFVVRQPDDDERAAGVVPADARGAEMEFFRTHPPWAATRAQDRLGTAHLVRNVSRLLTQIIRDDIPGLQHNVATQLAECARGLAALPPPIAADPAAFVLDLVMSFCKDVGARVGGSESGSGSGAATGLVQRTRQTYEACKRALRSTAPPFVPFDSERGVPGDVLDLIYHVDRKGREKRAKTVAGRLLYLQDVREHIRSSVTRELPNNVPYSAKVALILSFQRTWEAHAIRCFNDVDATARVMLHELVAERFARYGSLRSLVGPIVMQLADECKERTIGRLRELVELERTPFTLNSHYLSDAREKRLAHYKDARAGKVEAERVVPIPDPDAPPPEKKSKKRKAPAAETADPHDAADEPQAKKARLESAPAAGPVIAAKGARKPSTSSMASTLSGDSEALNMEPKVPSAKPSKERTKEAPPAKAVTTKSPPPQDDSDSGSDSDSSSDSDDMEPDPRVVKARVLQKVLAGLAVLGYTGVDADALVKLVPADEYEEELGLMAEVRAYFQVSYKRVIDYIPMTIDRHFLFELAQALQRVLFDRLGLGGEHARARCAAYIAEDPHVVARRSELLERKRRLESVQKALQDFAF